MQSSVNSEEHGKLIDLIDYVAHLALLTERPILELKSYKHGVIHEIQFRNRLGVRHDEIDDGGSVWLTIDRLQRGEPPAPPELAKPWLKVGRDPWKEPSIAATRQTTVTREVAAQLVADGKAGSDDVLSALKAIDGLPLDICCDVMLSLDRQPEERDAVTAYVEGAWRRWAETEKPRRETIALYEQLFSLMQLLANDTTERPLELVWGIGLARWKRDTSVIDHPILEQLVELELDERAALHVRPRNLSPRLHLQPFEALQIDGAATVRREAQLFLGATTTPSLSPFERSSFEPVLRLAVQWLDAEARYWPDITDDKDDRTPPVADEVLSVTDGWVLYARPRSENVYAQDLARLKDQIRDQQELPVAAARFVQEPSDEPHPPSWPVGGTTGEGGSGGTGPDPLVFFFPKPFNKEQEEIVRRLERADGLVVQGPPGTGKTHTIANIVCHYLATGRRVLVSSKGEGALAVLREHLPEAIRDLAIALLTSEREGMRQLERAVSILANKLVQTDPHMLVREIRQAEARMASLQRDLDAVDRQLAAFADKHLRRIELGDGRSLLPAELARSLVEDRERHAWLQDRPGSDNKFEPALDDATLGGLRIARRRLGQDLIHLDAYLPAAADLPEEARLLAIHRGLVDAALLEASAKSQRLPRLAIDEERAVEHASSLADRIQRLLELTGLVENTPWTQALARRFRSESPTTTAERALVSGKPEALERLMERRAKLLGRAVLVPEGAELNETLKDAIERAASGRPLFGTFRGLVDRGASVAKTMIASIRIDGRSPQQLDDWRKVAAELTWRHDVRTLLDSWTALAFLGVPSMPASFTAAVGSFESFASSLTAVLALPGERAAIAHDLGRLFPTDAGLSASLASPGGIRELLARLRMVVSRHQLQAFRAALNDILTKLSTRHGSVAQGLAELFSKRIGDPDSDEQAVIDEYEQLRVELERQRLLSPDFDTVRKGAAAVEAMGAPLWAEALRREVVIGEDDPWTRADWRATWDWWRRDAYLRAIDGRQRIRDLSGRRVTLEDELRATFQDIVRDRTYLLLKERMSNRVLAALQKFLVAMRRIGKGTGKGAIWHREDARNAMTDAAGAVPCWIMPHWRIAESLPPRLADFDLVIVDEASQSDLFALPAILRGKKLLVVGDEKQVSPTASFIALPQLAQLRGSFLSKQYFKDLMLPGNSLYDLAGAVFPGERLMLREHFRCVEPIIRFSMQFYDAPDGRDPLHPVRLPKASERLDPPLVAIHVPHGRKTRSQTNPAEAEVIVDELARLVADPTFGNRSIGVVSLIGARQAELIQNMVLERLGEAPFVRHQIACGDSATFQGKERYVMLVSMVECPESSTAKTATMFQQRFNVAMSRARDRMILIHSVTEEQLKPDDLKAKVLRHFKDPMAGKVKLADDLLSLCQSEFERDVMRRLMALGFRASPQVRVGPYAIDIVVEGAQDRRLAIELDGDSWHGPDRWQEDLVRQRVLERCGWRFWRCWASSFAIDPEGCMADLQDVLGRLGIEPTGNAWQPPIYTEFRTAVHTPDPESPEQGDLELPDFASSASAEAEPPTGIEPSRVVRPPTPTPVRDEAEDEPAIDIGDRFVMIYTEEPNRQIALTMTASDHQPEVGLVAASHTIFKQFLGAAIEEQLQIQIDSKIRQAVILAIDKRPPLRRVA